MALLRPLLACLLCAGAALLAAQPAAQPAGPPGAPPAPGVRPAPAPDASGSLARAGDLLTTQRGSIPIILTAPHGGAIRVPGSADRTTGITVRDTHTAEIALLVAQRLTERLGQRPYVVIAQFSRKDADANRAPGEAYENDAAKAQYDAFHAAVRDAVDECRRLHGRAILLDIHGQARVPGAIVRGTRNGRSVAALRARHGDGAIEGPESLFGLLRAAGYATLPEPGTPEEGLGRETFFDGGFIVEHYGSHQPAGIDAIQVEIGSQFRSPSPWTFARDLADAAARFYETFMQ
jgi:N-formylglutamate amidohydrolase